MTEMEKIRNEKADENLNQAIEKYGAYDFLPRTSGFKDGWDAAIKYLSEKEALYDPKWTEIKKAVEGYSEDQIRTARACYLMGLTDQYKEDKLQIAALKARIEELERDQQKST